MIFPILLVAMRETKEALENISSSLEVLQEGTGKLQASLSGERASLSNTLSDPACTNGAVSHTCNTIRSALSQLGISADFSRVQNGKQNWKVTGSMSFFLFITIPLVFLSFSSQMSVTPWPMSTQSWEQISATLYKRSVSYLIGSWCNMCPCCNNVIS